MGLLGRRLFRRQTVPVRLARGGRSSEGARDDQMLRHQLCPISRCQTRLAAVQERRRLARRDA